MGKVFVAGVGMIPFAKPGASKSYDEMGREAAQLALTDAAVDYKQVQQAYAGYVYGDSTCGQKALYPLGMTGIPVFNVNNNCSTGSSALFLARQAIEAGAIDVALAVGFEQMKPGALGSVYSDRPSPFDDFDRLCDELVGMPNVPLALRYFGGAGLAHMKKYGTKLATFAKIRAKASRHAAKNPLALFKTEVTAEQVLDSPVIWEGVMTRLMACPPTCGGAAAVLVSESYAKKHGLSRQVELAAQAMTTDTDSTFAARDMRQLVGFDMAKAATEEVYAQAGIGPKDVPRRRAARLFRAQRAHLLRGARLVRRRRRGEARRGRRQHLRRSLRDESIRWPSQQGAPARRHRPGAVLRADAAAPWQRGRAPGGRREGRPPAQPRPWRRLRRHALQARRSLMVDLSKKGLTFEPHNVTVEAAQLRFFARAIGETDLVYTDEAAAKAAGYAALPVPPTFLFSLESMRADPLDWLVDVGLELSKILHGEQSFTYHCVPVAGDTLTFTSRITDVFSKKNGALDFVVRETRVTDAASRHVADLKAIIVQRNS